MSTKFYPLRIQAVHRETVDAVSLTFDVPADLQTLFAFKQGQYLTLRSELNGEDVRRSYSICSGVQEGTLRVAIKQVDGGLFSTFANQQLKTGDVLDVMPPQGRFFTELDPAQARTYVAFASGSGITPIMSLLKTTLLEEPQSRFILFFGNKGFDHIIFREELESLKNQYPDRLSIHHVFSRESLGSPLFYGRIDAEKCAQYARLLFDPTAVHAFFLCGPAEMIFAVKESLEKAGAKPESIHFELFTTAGMTVATKTKKQSDVPEFVASITLIQDGAQFDFVLPSAGSTLLDAAMRAGADLPFSCKGGVCCTCKAKILEGSATMDLCYGLEPDEIEAGYILTCQAHPITEKLVVSFDA
ncbi:MAG: phenylacetate-CoA oxygenase/reductase subunit PaaK [Bacteroidetes bacterium]|nr:phenylacetate-CoA oxygenase/reductase subunit PaaK [Bacteroidota bacterium]